MAEEFQMNFDGQIVENGQANIGASAMARAIQKAVANVDLDDSEEEEDGEWEYEDEEEEGSGGGDGGSYSDAPKKKAPTSGASAYRRGDMIVKMPPKDVMKKENAAGGGVLGSLGGALNIFGGDEDSKAKFHRFAEYSVSFEKGPICLNLEQDVQHG